MYPLKYTAARHKDLTMCLRQHVSLTLMQHRVRQPVAVFAMLLTQRKYYALRSVYALLIMCCLTLQRTRCQHVQLTQCALHNCGVSLLVVNRTSCVQETQQASQWTAAAMYSNQSPSVQLAQWKSAAQQCSCWVNLWPSRTACNSCT